MNRELAKQFLTHPKLVVSVLGLFWGVGLLSVRVFAANPTFDSCAPIDYQAQPDSCFRKIPVYDQAETGICYAYAASQMVDCYRFSHGDPSTDLTNPVYAATISKTYNPRSRINSESLYGGFSENVIEVLKSHGSCSQSEVEKNLALFKSDLSVGDAQVLAFLEESFKKYNQKSSRDSVVRLVQNKIQSLGQCELQYMANIVDLAGLQGIGARTILEEVFRSCEAKLKQVKLPPIQTFDAGSDAWIKKNLDAALSRNPVSIGVCSQFFDEYDFQGLKGLNPPFTRRSTRNVKGSCKPHAVVVTGRRNVGGKCQYLVRNSWGTSWQAPTAATCACYDLNDRYWEDCSLVENIKEYVGCWFDADAMLKNTTEVTAFQ